MVKQRKIRIRELKGRKKKEKREAGDHLGKDIAKIRILLYLAEKYPNYMETREIADFLRERFNIVTRKVTNEHLEDLWKEGFLKRKGEKNKVGEYINSEWKLSSSRGHLIEIVKKIATADFRSRLDFTSSNYVNQVVKQLLVSIGIKAEIEGYMLLIENSPTALVNLTTSDFFLLSSEAEGFTVDQKAYEKDKSKNKPKSISIKPILSYYNQRIFKEYIMSGFLADFLVYRYKYGHLKNFYAKIKFSFEKDNKKYTYFIEDKGGDVKKSMQIIGSSK